MRKFYGFWPLLCGGLVAGYAQMGLAAADVPPPVGDITLADFLSQVVEVALRIGGLSTMMKVSVVILLLVSALKVGPLKALWTSLGFGQVWLAPLLALVAGLLGLGTAGAPFSLALALVYMTTGAGAVFLHEILDSVKTIPGIGPVYLKAIQLVVRPSAAPAVHADMAGRGKML